MAVDCKNWPPTFCLIRFLAMSNKTYQTAAFARIMAGVPTLNAALYRRIRFLVGDPVALVELNSTGEKIASALILRDIEMDRARKNARVDAVHCPNDFQPESGLSGDRETATAQAAAELLRRNGCRRVVADRTLPLIYWEMLRRAGIDVECDTEWGVLERRSKDEDELRLIEHAQAVTEKAMLRACEYIATASAQVDGSLTKHGIALTSERIRSLIDGWLLEDGFSNPMSIVAGGPMGADCHEHGHGPLFTEQPIIVDIFPRDKQTLYNGDCTRTVVHGRIPERVAVMHQAVVAAKQAAGAAVRPGVRGDVVHQATIETIESFGFKSGLPGPDDDDNYTAMTHGTGHGLGLEVHEPPLLAQGGPELVVGDVLTIEPGLYCRAIGGVRIEDMVFVTSDGCRNVNRLPEGLSWKP
jgi:Xaa-Pro aminopeptidase